MPELKILNSNKLAKMPLLSVKNVNLCKYCSTFSHMEGSLRPK